MTSGRSSSRGGATCRRFLSLSLAILLSISFLVRTAMADKAPSPTGELTHFQKDKTDCGGCGKEPLVHVVKAKVDLDFDSQSRFFTSEDVNGEGDGHATNPQQTGGQEQVIDTDTYGGHTPDSVYPTDDPTRSSLPPDEALKDLNPPGPSMDVDPDIRQLAESMTLRELAGQMTQLQIGTVINSKGELDLFKVEYWIREWGVGSFLDTPTNHGGKYISYSASQFSKIVDAIQEVALSIGKGVPMIYGLDSVHGANYVDGAILFPQQIGVAATFNRTKAYEAGRITAKDTRAAGIPWVFTPILDVAVHKLWPRVYETYGEDPFVVSEMGSATIRGLQGNYKRDRRRVAACMKHFIGYSASRNGQDKSSAWIPDNYLLDYFVPPFQAANNSGVATAMETYIDVNGQPVVGSHFYLTELLRNRIGFKGMLVTDWGEVDRLYTEHRSAPTLIDAALLTLKQTSVDMVMVPESESFSKNAVTLVHEDKLLRERLVGSAAKVLQLKKDLGLFDQPFSDPKLLRYVGSQQDIEAAKNAARESITLLKNQNDVLPLKKGKKIVVTGPAANSIRALSGGWSIKWQGAETDDWYQGRGETIVQGLEKEFGRDTVSYVPSVDFDGHSVKSSDEKEEDYLDAIQDADTVILCLGEKPYAEIVGNIDDIDLPSGQLNVVRQVKARIKGTNTKVILVLVEGRPRGLQNVASLVDAIVMAYLPGPWGGHPIAEILSGAVNPSGRLPLTYPTGSSDMTTNYYRVGIDPYKPLFPFSAGLSYVPVEYVHLGLNQRKMRTTRYDVNGTSTPDDDEEEEEEDEEMKFQMKDYPSSLLAKVSVKNKGRQSVKETVFWYITKEYRSDVMPEAFMLKGFEKIELRPGQTKVVQFRINRDALTYHGRNLKRKAGKGKYILTVNAMRPEALSIHFEVV
ncbi:MAG: glycoside hydrolase superfamily [Benniella sp.]|nr:MAG: glycoside hydrolase superfamily [Benniella sp.]